MSAVDVLAVWDEARRFARDQSTNYETPYHLFTAMDEARTAVAELMEAAETILDPYTPVSVDAQYERLRAALARCKEEGA